MTARLLTRRTPLGADRRRVPSAVWCVTALFAALLAVWTVAAPVYQAPDEPQHVDLVRHLAAGGAWPDHRARQVDRRVVASLHVVRFATVLPDGLAAAQAPPRASRPPFAALGPSGPSDVYNQLTQHPPAYHLLLGGVLAALQRAAGAAAWPFDAVVATLRLVSAALVVWLPLLAWATVRRVGGTEEAGLAAAVVPLAVPQLAHTAASVSNDTLLVLLAGVLTLLLARAATGDATWRTALAAGGVTGLALLTKGLALVLVPWIALGYGVAAVRRSTPWGAALVRGGAAIGLAAAVGGWWWARNVLRGTGLLPLGGEALPVPDPGFTPSFEVWQWLFRDLLVQSYWGLFGWLDVPSFPALVWPAVVLVAGGAAVALAVGGRGRGWRRADAALLLVPTLVLAAAMAVRSWADYQVLGELVGVQGRYLFPGLVGLAAAVALGWSTLVGAARRWLPLAVLGAVALLQAGAIATVLAHFWISPDAGAGATAVGAGLASLVAWAPWHPAATAGVAVALVGTGLAATVALAHFGLTVGRSAPAATAARTGTPATMAAPPPATPPPASERHP